SALAHSWYASGSRPQFARAAGTGSLWSAKPNGGGMSNGGLMVSVSGIRGRVGEALDPEVVARFAAAFGAWAVARGGSRSIVVGRDSRVSGPLFHRVVL